MRSQAKGWAFKVSISMVLVGMVCFVVGLNPAQAGEGHRSYYFSRDAKPYDSYESWLQAHPRDMHPYHATVHGPLFHQDTDAKAKEYKTKPIRNHPAFRAEAIQPPYGYNRILWVNDRYYSGKYYPTAEKTESASGEAK